MHMKDATYLGKWTWRYMYTCTYRHLCIYIHTYQLIHIIDRMITVQNQLYDFACNAYGMIAELLYNIHTCFVQKGRACAFMYREFEKFVDAVWNLRMLQTLRGRYKLVTGVTRTLQGHYKDVKRTLQGRYTDVTQTLHRRCKDATRALLQNIDQI